MSCVFLHAWYTKDFLSDGYRVEKCSSCGDERVRKQPVYVFDAVLDCGAEVALAGLQRKGLIGVGDEMDCKVHNHTTRVASITPRGDGKVPRVKQEEQKSTPEAGSERSVAVILGILAVLCIALFVWSLSWHTFFTVVVGGPAILAGIFLGVTCASVLDGTEQPAAQSGTGDETD